MFNANCVIRSKPCYFCGNTSVVEFGEHHIFCPNCSAIYTFMILWDACAHVVDAPVLIRYPWFDDKLDRPFVYAALLDDPYPYRCSECDRLVVAEGAMEK